MIPLARIDCASSSSRSFCNSLRGCSGLGSMESMAAFEGVSSRTGGGGATGGRVGSSAPRPLPSARRGFSDLFMIQNLFCEFDVALRAFGTRIVAQDGFAETGRLREPDAAWNHG